MTIKPHQTPRSRAFIFALLKHLLPFVLAEFSFPLLGMPKSFSCTSSDAKIVMLAALFNSQIVELPPPFLGADGRLCKY